MKHSQLRELFIATCDLPPAEQIEYLETHCVDQPELQSELLKLLEQDQTSGLFSDGSTLAGLEFQLNTVLEAPHPPKDLLGRYELGNEIARGGMGAIIEARDRELGRKLAIKVLLDEHRTNPKIVQRFLDEAQIAGQLQHPGIAPVYEVGQLSDKRPFISMKLIRGKTLSSLLKQRNNPKADLARFLGIFEQVCQTIGYAHSKDVIHRDLKPSNIMVGAFGEVQVMDWGLAKVLSDDPSLRSQSAGELVAPTPASKSLDGFTSSISWQTEHGSIMGTPAYMPPEQALGKIHQLDRRTDVFALGAILCEILTGHPIYQGNDNRTLLDMASRADLQDCFQRLDETAADKELVDLAKICLSDEKQERPSNGEAISKRINGYLSSVETRLRQAEIARAKQAVQIREERKRQKVFLAFAITALLAIVAGVFGWNFVRKQRAEGIAAAESRIDRSLNNALVHSKLAATANPESDPTQEQTLRELELALADTQDALELAESNPVDSELVSTLHKLKEDLSERKIAAKATAAEIAFDREIAGELKLIRLVSGRGVSPLEMQDRGGSAGSDFHQTELQFSSKMYQQTFTKLGINFAAEPINELAQKIENSRIREDLIAALDNWARSQPNMEIVSKPLTDPIGPTDSAGPTKEKILALADALDRSPWRKKLRSVLSTGNVSEYERLAMDDETQLQSNELICWLAVALRNSNANKISIDILRRAQRRSPNDFWLNYELGKGWAEINGKESEAIGYFRTALGIRPESLVATASLGSMLRLANQFEEAEVLARRAIETTPSGPTYHNLALCQFSRNRFDEAKEAYEKAIELEPNFAYSYFGLGYILHKQGKLNAALKQYEKAIELEPQFVEALVNTGVLHRRLRNFKEAISCFESALRITPGHFTGQINLAFTLNQLGKPNAAIHVYQKALEIDSSSPTVHYSLANLLKRQGRTDEAIEAYQNAIKLKPDYIQARVNLGNIFRRNGRLDEAIEHYQAAIDVKSDFGIAYLNLGNAFSKQGKSVKAIEAFRIAVAIDPQDVDARYNLGFTLEQQGNLNEAAREFRTLVTQTPKDSLNHKKLAWMLVKLARQEDDAERSKQLLSEALPHAKRACDLAPDNSTYFTVLGITQYYSEQWEASLDSLNKMDQASMKKKTFQFKALLFSAMSNWKLDNQEHAIELYNAAANWRSDHSGSVSVEQQGLFDEAKNLIKQKSESKSDQGSKTDSQ